MPTPAADGRLAGARIGVLLESDFYEHEIWYYSYRFPEEGAELHFLTRLWGQDSLTFTGHEYKAPFATTRSFEDLTDDELRSYSAIIVPSGMVSDRLRWTEDVAQLPPATAFLARAFAQPDIVKGIICHGMWLVSPLPDLVKGRPVTCHNNLHSDIVNLGATYVDADVVVDGDLVTGRTGGHAHLFARRLIDEVQARRAAGREPISGS